jgi:hypothetical protein
LLREINRRTRIALRKRPDFKCVSPPGRRHGETLPRAVPAVRRNITPVDRVVATGFASAFNPCSR